jgi:hypothetical protein
LPGPTLGAKGPLLARERALSSSDSEGVTESFVEAAKFTLILGGQQGIELPRKSSERRVSHATLFIIPPGISNCCPADIFKNISQKYNAPLIVKRALPTRIGRQTIF